MTDKILTIHKIAKYLKIKEKRHMLSLHAAESPASKSVGLGDSGAVKLTAGFVNKRRNKGIEHDKRPTTCSPTKPDMENR